MVRLCLIGGIELHARIGHEGNGISTILFTFQPTVHDREIPGWIAEFNTVLEGICRITVAAFPDPDCFSRICKAVKRDGPADRCWYRLTVTVLPGKDDRLQEIISDAIDPDLLRADPHVAYRAKKARAMVMRCMRESKGEVKGGRLSPRPTNNYTRNRVPPHRGDKRKNISGTGFYLPGMVKEPSPRTLELCAYASTLFLCGVCIVVIFLSVSRQCDRIFRDAGQYDCGVGWGWAGLVGAFVLVAGYAAYGLWRMYR